jgi:hypothetical protein
MQGTGNFKIENRCFVKRKDIDISKVFCRRTSDDTEVRSEACLLTP